MTLTSTPSRGPCSKPSGSIAVLMQAIMLPPAMPSAPAAAAFCAKVPVTELGEASACQAKRRRKTVQNCSEMFTAVELCGTIEHPARPHRNHHRNQNC